MLKLNAGLLERLIGGVEYVVENNLRLKRDLRLERRVDSLVVREKRGGREVARFDENTQSVHHALLREEISRHSKLAGFIRLDPYDDPYLTVRQVAERLGLSEGHVRNLISCRRLPFVKSGSATRVHVGCLSRWLSAGRPQELAEDMTIDPDFDGEI